MEGVLAGFVTSFILQEPFDAKRALAALDAYDQPLPNGRYNADTAKN